MDADTADAATKAARTRSRLTRPGFGDRVCIIAEKSGNDGGTGGIYIKYYGYMVGEGYGKRGTGRKTVDCDEGLLDNYSDTRQNDDYCIVMVPSYRPDTGRLLWSRCSALCSNVVFDSTSIRMIDEAYRSREHARVWKHKLAYLEANINERLVKDLVNQVFDTSDSYPHYGRPDARDVAALLVAAGILPPIDFDAATAAAVRKELAEFNEECRLGGPVDFTG